MPRRASPNMKPDAPEDEERSESLGSYAGSDEEQQDGDRSSTASATTGSAFGYPDNKTPESGISLEPVMTPENFMTPESAMTPESVVTIEFEARGSDEGRVAARASQGPAAAVDKSDVVRSIDAADDIEFAEAARSHKFYRARDSIVIAKHHKPRPADSEVVDTGTMALFLAGGAALVLMAICTVTFVTIKMMHSLVVAQGNFSRMPGNYAQPIARIGVEQGYDVTFAEASENAADYADLLHGQNSSGETTRTSTESRRLSNVLSLI
ncbi:hypothetical protein MTO96_018343 [Rhipicephalus appendiculatus]